MFLRASIYCLVSPLVFAVAVNRSLSPHALAWSFLQGCIIAVALFPVVRWSAVTPAKLFAILWLVLMIVGVMTLASEEAIFMTLPLRQIVREDLRLAISYTVFAAALAYLPMGLRVSATEGRAPTVRGARTTALAILPASVAYLVVYFIFGAIAYQVFTKPYYTHQVAGGEALNVAIPGSLVMWLPAIQIARGALLTIAVLPIIRTLRVSRASTAIIVGSVLWVVGGLAPLLVPGAYMPGMLRLYHTVEIFTQNFTLGVIVTWMMRPGEAPAHARSAAMS
jgi:hypothetical protein